MEYTIRARGLIPASSSTAGRGKPHVRWCGSPDGRKSRRGAPICQRKTTLKIASWSIEWADKPYSFSLGAM